MYAELNPDIVYRIIQNRSKFCNDNANLLNVANYRMNVLQKYPITINPIIEQEADELFATYHNYFMLQIAKVTKNRQEK